MIVRWAEHPSELLAVWRLTYCEHLRSGWCLANDAGELRHHPYFDTVDGPTRVWLLEDDTGIAGTVSVTIDGDDGLPQDVEFADLVAQVCEQAEANGQRVAGVWRMVVRRDLRCRMAAVQTLITTVIDDMLQRKIDLLLTTIHPRHADFYRKRLGFDTLGHVDHDAIVGGAPAVLMVGQLPQMITKWAEGQ